MKPLRIAHVTATFPPYWGGTGNVCFYNARELTRRGHDVHVYTPNLNSSITQENSEGIHVHRQKPILRFGNAALMPNLLSLKNFDVIHLHFPFFGGEFSALAAYMRHIPLIVTYHQDVHLQGILKFVEYLLRLTISRWVLNHAHRILFTSVDYSVFSYIHNILDNRENHIGELPNGVDPKHFFPGQHDPVITQKYKSSYEDKIALLVARLDRAHYFKGVPIFLQAVAQLPEFMNAVIVGEGDMKEEYEKLAYLLEINKRVDFAGRVSIEDLPKYYCMADVTVLPSTTMSEAFGLVLVESLACGTPVIATDIPGVRTVVSDGLDGYLVQPGDVEGLRAKLQQILSMPDLQKAEMGCAGRCKVEQKYTWELAGQRLEAIYLEVISELTGKTLTK